MRARAAVGALVVALLVAAAPASAASDLKQPKSATTPPAGYKLTARQVERIAARPEKVAAERREHRQFRATAYTKGPGRWQVSWFDRGREVAQVKVDDSTGAVLEAWTGHQVAWTMARGYPGAFGRKLNAPYVWIPLCVLFLAPFFDPRRPFRVVHLDLLVLLGFGLSHFYFNRGDIDTSVPLVYPFLGYLLLRMLWLGSRPRARQGPLLPWLPAAGVALLLVVVVAFRIGLNVVDSNVIDVGYAGVLGADRIMDGEGLYGGERFSADVEHGDTYGPLNYVAYIPFEQALPWSGAWDDLPAAHGAALTFDLLTLLGLFLLGRRLRAGPAGRELGVALAFAWAAFPYSSFALETNSNDSLVALSTVGALLALTWAPARARLSDAGRALAIGLGAGAKFAPLALAPLFATAGTGPLRSRLRSAVVFGGVLALVLVAAFVPAIPDGGIRELYDSTVGYQASRPTPFAIWGQVDGIGWLHTVAKGGAVALALAVAFVPRQRDAIQTAALGAAVLIAVQLAVSYWFYLYVVWFAPLVLVAVLARTRTPEPDTAHSAAEPAGVGAPVAA
jgi:hypothetical protein